MGHKPSKLRKEHDGDLVARAIYVLSALGKRPLTRSEVTNLYTAISAKRSLLFHLKSPRPIRDPSSTALPWENHPYSLTQPQSIKPTNNGNIPLQYAQSNFGSVLFGSFLNGALYNTSNADSNAFSLVGFYPSKLAFLPMTPSTTLNGNPDLDWSLVAMGIGTFQVPSYASSLSTAANNTYVATVMAMDPYTGQFKRAYSVDPTKPTMQRYTIPNILSTGTAPLSVSPAGMVYHPTFGIMVYGPVTYGSTPSVSMPPAYIRNPFLSDPSNVNPKLTAGATLTTNYGTFTPDIAGVSFGNVAQTIQWMLVPSCDWDAINLPGNLALAANLQKTFGNNNTANVPLDKMMAVKPTDITLSSSIVLTNGTMMVETFPELASNTSSQTYGFVSCGFSSSSANTQLGLPGSQGQFALFVNLYYYYDPTLFPTWPDTCSKPPVTTGWMMPRNVANPCLTPVSGKSPVNSSYYCPTLTANVNQSNAGSGPYPAFGNYVDKTSPCMCLLCGQNSPQEAKGTIVPCADITNFTESNGVLTAIQSPYTYLNPPYSTMATYPDDPVHVPYTLNEPVNTNSYSGCVPAFGNFRSITPALDPATMAGVPFGSTSTNANQISNNLAIGGYFVTWFDTVTDNVLLPIALKVYQSSIYIVGYTQGQFTTPMLYELGLVDISKSPPAPATTIGPTTTVQVLYRTDLNKIITSFTGNPFPIGDLTQANLASISDVQILDFGANPGKPFPVLSILGTIYTSYYVPGTDGYPIYSVAPDTNTSSNLVGGPATVVFSLNPGSGDAPTLIEIDMLSANNNQNTNAGVMAPNNPLVRGLVRTNLSMPSFGVVSEAVNNTSGTPYCSTVSSFGGTTQLNVCGQFTVGDPTQNMLQVTSIAPPDPSSSSPNSTVVTVGSQPSDNMPIQYTWNSGTNAAMLSHIKLFLPQGSPSSTLVPPGILGSPTNFQGYYKSNTSNAGGIWFPELPSLTYTSLQNNPPADAINSVPAKSQLIHPDDLFVGLSNVSSINYKGWTQDLANRFRSQFRGQVLRHNLQGFVAQVLSFFPGDLITSSNTDTQLKLSASANGGLALYNQTTYSTQQQVMGYVLSWATLTGGVSYFFSQPQNSPSSQPLYNGMAALGQSVISPVYGPLTSCSPNVIVHTPNIDNSKSNQILDALYPVAGSLYQSVYTPYWQPMLDPGYATTTTNGQGSTSSLLINFLWTQSPAGAFSNAWNYNDPTQSGTKLLPRPVHPSTGLTTCTQYDATQNTSGTAADTDDYNGLSWASQFVASNPFAAPNNPLNQQSPTIGWRSMMGLQAGNLNVIGPGAYYLGNDQQMIPWLGYGNPWNAQVGFGVNYMSDNYGQYIYAGANIARCGPVYPSTYK